MKFDEILIEEPRLIWLMFEADKNKHLSEWGRERYWNCNLKPRMVQLVGFHSDNEELSTSEVYDTVYRFFIDFMRI